MHPATPRLLAFGAAACLTFGLSVDSEAALRARAFGAWVNVPNYGTNDVTVCDTGWLPGAGGGLQTASAYDYQAGSVLYMSEGTATANSDDDCEDEDDSVSILLGPTVLMPGYASELTFTSLSNRDDDDCCDGDDDDFDAATITELYFGGTLVNVTGEPNQEIVIAGVGRLVINEVVFNDDGDECDDDDDMTINALHLWPTTGGEIIVGSTIYDDDDDCCATGTRSLRWGDLKIRYR